MIKSTISNSEPTIHSFIVPSHRINLSIHKKIVDKIHTHQKPFGLIEQLILATTNENDIVLDPCAGSYTVLDVCKKLNRNFIGGDLI